MNANADGKTMNGRRRMTNESRVSPMGTSEAIVRHNPDIVSIHAPTVNGNEAVDFRQVTAQGDNLVHFGAGGSGQNCRVRKAIIHKQCDREIPHMNPTVMSNQAKDYREQDMNGHARIIPLSSNPLSLMQQQPIARSRSKKISPQRSEFFWEDSILWWQRDEKNKFRLANFTCTIVKIYILIGRKDEKYMLRVRYERACSSVEMDIPLGIFITKNYEWLTKDHPEYRLYPDVGNHRQGYKLYCSEISERISELPTDLIYEFPGWQKGSGRRHYGSAGDENCLCTRQLAPLAESNPKDVLQLGLAVLQFASMETMLPMLLQMHLGVTMMLFQDAGYHESFVFLIIAPTGNGKSYVARTLFNYFGGSFINFESTDRAIELELEKRIDATVVLDDLKSGRNKHLAEKLEHVLRQLGDMVGRKKSVNGGKEQESTDIRCNVVITAESDIDELQSSGRYRTLAIFVKPGELVNSPLLKQYHDDNERARLENRFSAFDVYMSAYVHYLEIVYSDTVQMIRNMDVDMPNLQSRQATIYKMLAIQAWIVLRFWCYFDIVDQAVAEEVYRMQWLPVLRKIMQVNGQRGRQSNPALMLLRAISEGIVSHRLPVEESKDAFENTSSNVAGYWDGNVLKLLPDYAFDFVTSYYAKLGIKFIETQNGVLTRLHEKGGGILEVYDQKEHKAKLLKKIKIHGRSVSVMCLKWPAVEKVLEEADLEE